MTIRGFLPLALIPGLLSAGCTGTPFGDSQPSVAAPTPLTVNMTGRWRLVSGKGGACGMTFSTAGTEGRIAPEGGCPANFFTSRYWIFEQGALVIQDHTRKPLLAMKQNAAGRFEGELPNQEQIWLER